MAVVLVLALVAGAGVATATHQADEADNSDWFGDGVSDDASVLDRALERVAKSVSQAYKGLARAKSGTPFGDDLSTAEESAQDSLETFNAHNDTIRTWANTHLSGNEDHEVFQVTFTDRDDGEESIYIVADYNTSSGEYDSAEALNGSEFQNRDRTVDATIEFGWYASDNAAAELEEWVNRFGESNEQMSGKYRADMLSKYADDVEHDLI